MSRHQNILTIEEIPNFKKKSTNKYRIESKHRCLNDIPLKMRESRRRNLCSQRAIAKRSGVPLVTYQRIESGKKSPTLEQLEKIAKALKTSFGALTGLVSQPDPSQENYAYPDTYRCYLTNMIYYGAGRDGKIPKRKLIALLYWCELVWYFENACSGLTKERYYKTEFGPLAGFWRDRPTDELVRLIARQAAWRRADLEQEIDFHETFGDEPQRLYGAAISLATIED